jgi:hypothetical protein
MARIPNSLEIRVITCDLLPINDVTKGASKFSQERIKLGVSYTKRHSTQCNQK